MAGGRRLPPVGHARGSDAPLEILPGGEKPGKRLGVQTYAVEIPEAAWLPIGGVPPAELVALVRAALEQLAAELGECHPRPSATVVSRQLVGGYVALVAVNHEKCLVTLVEVAARST
jgi:hypothetical protein